MSSSNQKQTSSQHVICNIGELMTLAPLVQESRYHSIKRTDLGLQQNAWLAIDQGSVRASGTGTVPEAFADWNRIDAGGGLVMPGLVDSHTHPLFGGSRAGEFARRLSGATYQEIAEQGGGIQCTVGGSRNASDEQLIASLKKRLAGFLKRGITTAEVKSGYGLSVEEELRHLRLLNRAKELSPLTLSVTCLALHASSPEHDSLEAYIADVNERLLPVVAKDSLADWVDAFIETGYFEVNQVRPYTDKARELGLGIRLHADEFTDARAGAFAAECGARSADHLQFVSGESIEKMAAAGTVATVLPGTSLYTCIPYTQAAQFTEARIPVAVASDFNPGSSYINNLPMLATLSSLYCGLSAEEAVAGVSLVAAHALDLDNKKGALANGHDADVLIYNDLSGIDEWLYDFGSTPPDTILIGGAEAL